MRKWLKFLVVTFIADASAINNLMQFILAFRVARVLSRDGVC